jgi:hypothetical protein
MAITNYQEITMESEMFDHVRENFDLLLQRLLKKMEKNKSNEGTITLKVDVKIVTDFVAGENGNAREIEKPVILHKIDTKVPIKDNLNGKQDTDMELVYDKELRRYVLKYVSIGGQRSMFDPDFEDIINGTATEVKDTALIEGKTPLLTNTNEDEKNDDSSVFYTENEEIVEEMEETDLDGSTEITDDDSYEYEE